MDELYVAQIFFRTGVQLSIIENRDVIFKLMAHFTAARTDSPTKFSVSSSVTNTEYVIVTTDINAMLVEKYEESENSEEEQDNQEPWN